MRPSKGCLQYCGGRQLASQRSDLTEAIGKQSVSVTRSWRNRSTVGLWRWQEPQHAMLCNQDWQADYGSRSFVRKTTSCFITAALITTLWHKRHTAVQCSALLLRYPPRIPKILSFVLTGLTFCLFCEHIHVCNATEFKTACDKLYRHSICPN
jgi:hypothetical protein